MNLVKKTLLKTFLKAILVNKFWPKNFVKNLSGKKLWVQEWNFIKHFGRSSVLEFSVINICILNIYIKGLYHIKTCGEESYIIILCFNKF